MKKRKSGPKRWLRKLVKILNKLDFSGEQLGRHMKRRSAAAPRVKDWE